MCIFRAIVVDRQKMAQKILCHFRISVLCFESAFLRAVFQFALDVPDAVAADIVEANIRALGDDHDGLQRLFSEYPVLGTAYRCYLSDYYSGLVEKHELCWLSSRIVGMDPLL